MIKGKYHNLAVSCRHVMSGQSEGIQVGEDMMCSFCWKTMERLDKKYKGKIPIGELDFCITVCKDCLKEKAPYYNKILH